MDNSMPVPAITRRKTLGSKLHMVISSERYHHGKTTSGVDDVPGTPSGLDRLVIAPGNLLVALFDVFVAICVLYTAIIECVAAEASFHPAARRQLAALSPPRRMAAVPAPSWQAGQGPV